MIKNSAAWYVEFFRNIPLLLQIFFWYYAALRALPLPETAEPWFGVTYMTIKGYFIPAMIWENLNIFVYCLLASFISISGGASVGIYGPLVHFGATVSSFIRRQKYMPKIASKITWKIIQNHVLYDFEWACKIMPHENLREAFLFLRTTNLATKRFS